MERRNAHIDDDLLIRYLAGEVTDSERRAIESWLSETADHHEILAGYRVIFEESKALKPGPFGNADEAWDRFKQKINEQTGVDDTGFSYKKWLGIAAAILVFLSVGIWFYFRSAPVIHFYAQEQPLVDSLPDGSLISLSSHSSLAFKPGRIREAVLKGEAFFEVKHDAAHPFRIKVNDVLINVLGTSFNIRSIGNRTEIMVRTGIVGVSGGNQSIRLQAGEQLLTIPGKNWHKEAQWGFDINSYPGLLRAILKDPKKWPELLKNYTPKQDTSAGAEKNKALVRKIIHQFITEKIVADGRVKTFRLDRERLIINGVVQPGTIYKRYKTKYLPPQDYFIYFGNEQPGGWGIRVSPDNF
jgi:ferric-dicitrate binding protein FerR (iron transport regulator)